MGIIIIFTAALLFAISYLCDRHHIKYQSCRCDGIFFLTSTGLGQLALFTLIWLCGPYYRPDHGLPTPVVYIIEFSIFYFLSFLPGVMIAATAASIIEGNF